MSAVPAVRIEGLQVDVEHAGATRSILEGLTLDIETGEIFGLVGPSGCGKSTVLRVLAGVHREWRGRVSVSGRALVPRRRFTNALRRDVQMVFQDSYSALHPRHTVARSLTEPLRVGGIEEPAARLREALTDVGLPADVGRRYPHQLSGGERQRVAIARATLLRPRLLLLDEPTSALDLSVQAEILNLLNRLQREQGMTLVVVSHDPDVIAHLCDRAAVMRDGRIERLLLRSDLCRVGEPGTERP